MLSQLQLLNKILQNKDFSVVTMNNLDDKFFFNYKAEFNYIKNHYEQYKTIPDAITFLNVFPDFGISEVTEPDSYLLEEIYKDYNQAYLAQRFNNIKTMLEKDQIDKASEYFKQSIEGFHTGTAMTCTDLITDTSRFDRYKERTVDQAKFYLKTGFPELDYKLSGRPDCGCIDRENENMIIMARPGQGKTQILLKMATVAAKSGLKVGIYEGEMTADKVGYRIDTFLGNISNRAMNHGYLDIQRQYSAYIKSLPDLLDKGSFIKVLTQNDVPSGEVTVDVLKAFIEQQKLDILFIDQYDLMEDTDGYDREFEKIGNIAKKIKKLQVEKKIPMIAVCQMTRDKENAKDTSRAAGSDKISRYATTMLALEQKTNEETKAVELTFDVVKARDGGDHTKLMYTANFDTGLFNYIPREGDEITSEEDRQNIARSYEVPVNDDSAPF